MKNAKAIICACEQIEIASKYVKGVVECGLAAELDGVDTQRYVELMMRGIRNVQMATVELSGIASDNAEKFDSVFAPGELNSVKDQETEAVNPKEAILEKELAKKEEEANASET